MNPTDGRRAETPTAASSDDPTQLDQARDESTQDESTWSVSDLTATVKQTIRRAFPDEVWVRGEIIGYSKASSGHVYFGLVEPGTGTDNRSVRMGVALFKGNGQNAVKRDLAGTSMKLSDDIEVRIRARLDYYPGRSEVQLIMSGIDPHFTLGVLAADRARILAELTDSGLLRRNAEVPLPLVPLRVGLVTADRSAACADFLDELRSSGYAFEVLLCDARVQGAEAEANLVEALRALGDADVDVIAMVRGGGDRTDLLAFDLASVAQAIALCPKPVFCGIGHETDESVADHVVHTSEKTPTACAAAIVEHVAAVEARLAQARHGIERTARASTATARSQLASARGSLGMRAQRRLDGAAAWLEQARLTLRHRSNRHLAHARSRLGTARALTEAHAPQRIMARGFSITRTADGAIVRDMPAAGDTVVTETIRATFTSIVESASPTTDTATDEEF